LDGFSQINGVTINGLAIDVYTLSTERKAMQQQEQNKEYNWTDSVKLMALQLMD
jgi:hypothetical protein